MKVLQFSEHPKRGPWDQTLAYDLFDGLDDNIFLIPAKDQAPFINDINNKLSEYDYGVVLIMSDEESLFPYELLTHPNMKVWVQYPKEVPADRYMPGGYSPGTTSTKLAPKTLDWFFAGQITHPAREEMARALRELTGGLLIETEGFTQGLPHQDYLDIMARAKIVPCPHGAATPDTLRLWEALELHCMPVIHDRDRPFYQKILGDFPFPSVSHWGLLKDLGYEDCKSWWNAYKHSMSTNMREDLAWLKSC